MTDSDGTLFPRDEGSNALRDGVRSSAIVLALAMLVFSVAWGAIVALAALDDGSPAKDLETNWLGLLLYIGIELLFIWGFMRALGWAIDPYSHRAFDVIRTRGDVAETAREISREMTTATGAGPLKLGRNWFVFRHRLGMSFHLGHYDDVESITKTYHGKMGPCVDVMMREDRVMVLTARSHRVRDAMAAALEARVATRTPGEHTAVPETF